MFKRIAVIGFLSLGLAACDRYAAEVGYRSGAETKWDIWGDFTSLEECRNAAISRYRQYESQSGRATSWACLLKNGKGGYTSRHR